MIRRWCRVRMAPSIVPLSNSNAASNGTRETSPSRINTHTETKNSVAVSRAVRT